MFLAVLNIHATPIVQHLVTLMAILVIGVGMTGAILIGIVMATGDTLIGVPVLAIAGVVAPLESALAGNGTIAAIYSFK